MFRADLRTYAVVRIAHDHQAAAVALVQRQGERVALRVRSFPEAPLPEGEYLPAAVLDWGHSSADLGRFGPVPRYSSEPQP